jgi:hypothetical protein
MKNKITILLGTCLSFAFIFYACNSVDSDKKSNVSEVTKADENNTAESSINYLSEEKKIANEAQSALGKNLTTAINAKGTAYAVEFCNVQAIPITDSMANILEASLKRVTDKTRNPKNQANEDELAFIKKMKEEMQAGMAPEPLVTELNGKMVGYYPIVTNALCVKCHGNKDVDIEQPTFRKIKALYPSDKALGYSVNNLRGMWVVEMNKK